MSYNMIDFNLYEKIDCKVEQHYHREFASYQKYELMVGTLPDKWNISINLVMEDNEANNPKYSEVVVSKNVEICYNNLYNSDPFNKLYKSLDAVLNPYYLVEISEDETILITAKIKGKVPSIQTPKIEMKADDFNFKLFVKNEGIDSQIYVTKPNEIHLPRTTFGENYKPPEKGDIVYIIDSVSFERDRTVIREIVDVEKNASCTCDVITLNLPVDRLPTKNRITGIGLQMPTSFSNNYTASFDKTQIWRRKDNFHKILAEQSNQTKTCFVEIQDFGMKDKIPHIISSLDKSDFQYFGAMFHWKKFESLLKPIYDMYGEYLREHLFLLKSNLDRPDYLLHIDYDEIEKDKPVVASLTWPAGNCNSDSITVWYECLDNGEKIYKKGKQDVVITDQSLELKEIDRFVFDDDKFNPIIIRQDEWHTVYNNSKSSNDRMLLQWRFNPNISWEKVLEITKEIHLKTQ